ncbi:MAG: enoyl-CoA hydratase/isomerase family protein [Cellvibrionaceae bacterium]|nr:enoyl-CoA hydratase/isomerase family protein [Cellvibrionaceae bacterium]
MRSENYQHINVEIDGEIALVQLNTGHKGNAFCLETISELINVADELSEDMSVHAVILRGQERLFSVGMNLNDPLVLNPGQFDLLTLRRASALGAKMCRAWENIEALTVSAIEGPCLGGGVALSLACDLRVCSSESLLYVPEIERGMNMSWQSVPRSVNLIGPAKTKRMFMLAEQVSAQQAFDWGWADYITRPGESVKQARELAQKAASMPPMSSRMCKQAINVAANALNHAVSYMDADQLVLTQYSEDFKEGIDSFLQKRPPKYKGK